MKMLNESNTKLIYAGKRLNNFAKLQGRLIAVLVLLMVASAFSVTSFAQTVITPNNLQNWVRGDTRPGGDVKLITSAGAPLGSGSLHLTTDNTTAAKAQFINVLSAPVPLSGVTALGYETKQVSAAFANGTASFQMTVLLNGTAGSFTTLVYEPYNNGETIINNVWQTWNPLGEDFWSSRTVSAGGSCNVTAGAGGPPFYTLATLTANCPSAIVVAYGVNIGSNNADWDIEVDAVNFNGTVYDFDPASSVSITPAASPTALDNDYTRINNPIQLIENGATLTLNGTFNWAETNAAASWVLGSDGQTGGAFSNDDYSILAPGGLNGVTVTASSLGAATIQGPGDLPAVSLEGVFQFYSGGTNQNWTISNLRILDIDNAIGFYYVSGTVNVYDGTQILNNYIKMPQDLNATVAPNDSLQNIGIHYAFGNNIVISGNTIDIPGDSVSDSANSLFAANIAIQSNTSGGAYEGLQILNNTINVLNPQGANPEVVIGIWENGHGHTRNITVSGNKFISAAPGNNPALNLQRGFRLTSHSSATSTVLYSNNRVEGANIGFQWLAGQAFGAHMPIVMTSNTIVNNNTGVKVDSLGSATMTFNRIAGNTVAAVENATTGTVTAQNNWWGCNFGPGAGGAGCAGTANGNIGTGTVASTVWLTLTSSATPNSIALGNTSAVDALLVINSATTNTSGSGNIPNGTPVAFVGTNGTVAPPTASTILGAAGTVFTSTAYGTGGVATTVDGQTVNAPIDVTPLCSDISTANTTTLTGVAKVIPVITSDLSTRNVVSADFTFTYNPATMTPAAIPATAGAVWAGALPTVTYFSPAAGTLNVSVYGSPPNPAAVGAGSLIDLHFDIIGPIGSTSGLALSNVLYNGGLACTTAPSNGTLTVISGTITGNITYANAAAPVVNVRGVLLNAPGTPTVSNTSDDFGNYSLSGFGPGSYTVTPTKTRYGFGNSGPITGIFSNDATLIAQHVVGITTLNATQLLAAKVSGNATPTLSSFDAALIAQWIVTFNPTNPINHTGKWLFTPTSVNHGVVNANAVQNYTAILLGDVNGSWSNLPGSFTAPVLTEPTKESVIASVPTMEAATGSSISVPFRIDNLKGKQITSYQFDIEYDPAVLKAGETGASLVGTNSDGLVVASNAPQPGLLKVVVYGALPVEGDGVYVNLNFEVLGGVGSLTPLTIRGFRFNDGNNEVFGQNGQLTVTEAANNVIRGNLMTAKGQPFGSAGVTLTNTQGESRTVIAGPTGKFEFGDLVLGETYTISVEAKRQKFRPVTVSMTESVIELNMIAN